MSAVGGLMQLGGMFLSYAGSQGAAEAQRRAGRFNKDVASWDKYGDKDYSTDFVDSWAESCFRKVNLTDAQNYDVITFKSSKTNLIIHFGLFLQPTKMLHIEEGGFSCIQTISPEWWQCIHSFYRHDKMV